MPGDTSEKQASLAFSANFRRYPADLTALLLRIERAVGAIRAASILPAAADQMRASAKAGTVHYSTLIEGNELPLLEAQRAAKGELAPDTRAKLELVNYVAALDLLDRELPGRESSFDTDFLLELHGTLMRDLGDPDSHFKPHHEGAWRDGRALVPNYVTGVIEHEGAPKDEVPPRMEGLCEWLSAREHRLDEFPPPVLAGVAHYAITDIHPFADGNGRMARLVAAGVLGKHDYAPQRLFCFDAYYAADRDRYLAALRSVRERTFNMEFWLQYFLTGLAEEYERVAGEIERLAGLGLTRGTAVQLNTTQQRAMSAFAVSGQSEFSRADYEREAGVGKAVANEDLAKLVNHHLIRPRGQGPSRRYVLGSRAPSSTGRPVEWTDARIEAALAEFLDGRGKWPSVREFREAGRHDLYLAMTRRGGVRHWRERAGYG